METTYALNENENLQEIKRPPRIGFIKTFAGTTPPEGTLLCDGSAVSRDTYSDLFDAIGTTWGEGDGSTTFNLPDLRDVWILCAGTEHEAGDSVAEGLPNIIGSAIMRQIQENENTIILDIMANPSGAFAMASLQANNFNRYIGYGLFIESYAGTRLTFNAQTSNAIYGASTHVTPASVAVLPCIVYE